MAAYAQAAPLIGEAPIAGRKLAGYTIPNDDCCKLFENDNYGGVEKQFCIGDNKTMFYNMKDVGFNDKMSSYICGKHVSARFCENNENDNCTNGKGYSAAGNTRSTEIFPHDKLTSLFLDFYDSENENGAVTMYEYDECEGR